MNTFIKSSSQVTSTYMCVRQCLLKRQKSVTFCHSTESERLVPVVCKCRDVRRAGLEVSASLHLLVSRRGRFECFWKLEATTISTTLCSSNEGSIGEGFGLYVPDLLTQSYKL